MQGDGSPQMGLRSGAFVADVNLVRAQALDLGGRSHGCTHFFWCSLAVNSVDETLTQYRRARSSGAPMNPTPPMGKRSSSQLSILLPSTLTVNVSPETRVPTVIAVRGFPGWRCVAVTGACATPPTTAQRLNSSSPPATAVSMQLRYSSRPAARTTQLRLRVSIRARNSNL